MDDSLAFYLKIMPFACQTRNFQEALKAAFLNQAKGQAR